MHPCPENWVAIGRAVVYYARAAHSFSAGIKFQPDNSQYAKLLTKIQNLNQYNLKLASEEPRFFRNMQHPIFPIYIQVNIDDTSTYRIK